MDHKLEEAEYPLANPDEMQTFRGDLDWKGKIVNMPVDKFLKLAAPLPAEHLAFPQTQARIEQLVAKMKTGTIDPLVLITDRGRVVSHEGRHRAYAAKRMGITEVPVLIIPRDFPRVPKWDAEQHRKVERARFKPEKWQ